jgi:transcription elongation factor Elf1
MNNEFDFESRRQDREQLYAQVVAAGGKPSRNNTFLCPFHGDTNPSSQIKKGSRGWYFVCYACGALFDVWDIEAKIKGIDISELVKEKTGKTKIVEGWKNYYATVDDFIKSIDAIDIEEVNKYTDPETGNADLLVVRYLPRGGSKKMFAQGYQTPKGFVKKRPSGLLPLFNRIRLNDSDTVLFVEGEKSVRQLTKLGFTATTGSGGSQNAASHDYSPLAGKRVLLWADNDVPGKAFMEQVRDKLLEVAPAPTVFMVDTSGLELEEGGDVVDLCEKVIAEKGTYEDCIDYVQSLVDDSVEVNRLKCLEDLLDDMRDGKYINLPIKDFPIITNEARMLLNKRIGIVYGTAGFGKTLFIGKTCDDLQLAGYKVARLQLEDEMEQHLLRSLAQQSLRGEIANDNYHRENPLESKVLYEQFKPTLDTLAPTITAGEHEDWNAEKILSWIESQLKAGKELVVVDPVSVVLDKNVWITSHRLMWGLKKILAKYPNGRVVLVSHPNAEGDISGGQSYKRFSHCMLMLNRFKKPKEVELVDVHGELSMATIDASIGIVKARYGKGNGIEVAVKLDPGTLKMTELGIIIRELDKKRKHVGKDFDVDDDVEL